MVKVFVSSVIPAPAEKVWAVVRDFNDMPNWHPLISRSTIEGGRPSDSIGCIRLLTLTDGIQVREQLLSLSDFDYSFSYAIIESGLDVKNYIAGLKLTPITDGNHTFAEWTAEFETTPGSEKDTADQIGSGVFQAGFDALKKHFAG
ncbi:MAG: SRPBCC family protein [Desulfobacterales bacterium]|nr:MAG: SRPBCC family protein [Desulfobacterales bacterium]